MPCRRRVAAVAYRYLWTPLDARAGDGPQPDRLLRPPHQLRPRRPADRAARRLLRRPGRRRRRADHHRGALDPPDRLAVREADPRLPPRRHPRLPADHRGRAPPPRADLRPDQPQRRPGVVDVHPAAGVGAVAGRRPAVPRGAQGGRRRPRSTRSSPATPPSPSTAPRAASTASSCSAATRSIVRGFLSPATNRRTDDYGGVARQPGPAAARDRRRRARRDRQPAWPSACGCAATS